VTRRDARAVALAFAVAHVPVAAAGAVAPGALGPLWLGRGVVRGSGRRAVRGFCVLDALAAGAVAEAVVRERAVAPRLAAGIATDVARLAVSVLGAARGRGPLALPIAAASAAGAATASALLPRVDAPEA
jgi:hypothetical protein